MKILIDGQTLSTPDIHRGIGIVFQELCRRLVINDISQEWLITVRNISDLNHLGPAVQKRLTPIVVSGECHQQAYPNQTHYYSEFLSKIVTDFKIDAYWVPNPLMLNVILPTDLQNVTIFTTVYDLIPLVMPQDYLYRWSEELQQEYRRRIEHLPGWADKLIFISESSKIDFEKIDPHVTCKSTVIPLAVDHTKFWPCVLPGKPQEPYILFTAGFSPRKNMDRAIVAFAQLISNHPQEFENLKFYIVCDLSHEARQDYERQATELGISDKLVLTGYLPEEKLVALYRGARVFFFPSRYEGFGLPVLEALACGLPVVTTQVSSIPEIIRDLAYYCSEDDPKDMALTLLQALRADTNNTQLRQKSSQRAQEFTWNKTAAKYSQLFRETLTTALKSNQQRYKTAYVSPWPPQRSGIAYYSYELVSQLKEYVDITLYLENQQERCHHTLDLAVKDIALLPKDRETYDCIIYHIGSHKKFHTDIYKMAWQYPGIIVLHDFNIHPFLEDAFLGTAEEYFYADALSQGYGEAGVSSYQSVKSGRLRPEIWQYPMSHALAKRSLATIVHSQWVKEQLQGIENVFVIPLGAHLREQVNQPDRVMTLQKRFGILPDKFLIATFGFVASSKRIFQILDAIKILLDLGYPIQFLIGGELVEPSMMLGERLKLLGIADNVIMSGYLSDEDFETCLSLSDIVINLRYPSLGESSAALMKALGYGKPCLVSNYQQFAELPNSVCWKVDIGDLEVPQIVAYLQELMGNPAARKQLGKNAAFFVENYSSYKIAAHLYASVIGKICKISVRSA